ncbi:hypothetical protein IAU60_005393 [Kwoniella sp. DSM 27419]
MCPGHDLAAASDGGLEPGGTLTAPDALPDWESLELPPAHILSHLTDAHCHSTDLTHHPSVYDAVQLGGLASMATVVGDQDKVRELSKGREWVRSEGGTGGEPSVRQKLKGKGKGKEGTGVGVVACFGYHPWFTHLYTLSDPSSIPLKEEHYRSLFSPSAKNAELLESLLPYLPDPVSFQPLLGKLREDIRRSLDEGRLTMLGEVGLDGSARLRWPKAARHLHPDHHKRDDASKDTVEQTDQPVKAGSSAAARDTTNNGGDADNGNEEDEWKRLTPFKVPMKHQRAILDLQMDLAVELGVNISLHSVACAGPTMEALVSMRDRHGIRFTNGINVDLHSAGGWSAEFWSQAQRNLLNLYASPSIFITGRSPHAPSLIRAIHRDRLLVESDSHDVRLSDRLVWAATEWISRCKGWPLEGPRAQPWTLEDDLAAHQDVVDAKGRLRDPPAHETWTVRTVERNWARFMRLIED